MKEKEHGGIRPIGRVQRIAGAYIAYVIGSGFATGQEIVRFFTKYGEKGILGILLAAILLAWVGAGLLKDGEQNSESGAKGVYVFYCGGNVGKLFEIFTLMALFLTVVVMISGAGAAFREYCGTPYPFGCVLMTAAVFASYILGFRRIVDAIGSLAPLIVLFMGTVSLMTLARNGMPDWNIAKIFFEGAAPEGAQSRGMIHSWWFSAVLYVSYNTASAVPFFHALGKEAESSSEAAAGGIVGTALLMGTALLSNLAFLSSGEEIGSLSIPMLYLAGKISPVFSTGFAVVLFIEIFSTAAPMMWTFCSRFAREGTRKARMVGILFIIPVYLLSRFSFESLVALVYPASGFFGLIFLFCFLRTKLSGSFKRRGSGVLPYDTVYGTIIKNHRRTEKARREK